MNEKICKISLFSMILACVAAVPGMAAVKVKNSNRSYASAYQQINAMRYEQEYAKSVAQSATTASAIDNLPVAVDDEKLANSIINNDASAPDISKLESCAMIYPNGVFKWAIPESGVRQNPTPQCVAVVELRDANTNAVLATTTVAAGDSMKCNIDYFPQSGYVMSALSNVELPADVAPTMTDVETVMNAEQKQNAGLKIVAAALVSGVAGNILAKKEAGDDKLLGTSKTQLRDTAIGAATGAGIMAASTYSGKVAGDTIKSTAVNAASGMIVGNMLAGAGGGDSVLRTEKCTINGTEHDCIAGKVSKKGEEANLEGKTYLISRDGNEISECESGTKQCTKAYKDWTDICVEPQSGVNCVSFKRGLNSTTTNSNKDNLDNAKKYYKVANNDATESPEGIEFSETTGVGNTPYYKITKAFNKEKGQSAYAVFEGMPSKKLTGYKLSDWDSELKDNATYYARYSGGSVGDKLPTEEGSSNTKTKIEYVFEPYTRNADDGGLVDLSNESRIKGTVAGGAVGGALGGIAGYSGAKDEVSERWTTSIREYEDSLSNFVCVTGGRYLSKYNSYVEIPEATKTE